MLFKAIHLYSFLWINALSCWFEDGFKVNSGEEDENMKTKWENSWTTDNTVAFESGELK